jgi:hypothetical protein
VWAERKWDNLSAQPQWVAIPFERLAWIAHPWGDRRADDKPDRPRALPQGVGSLATGGQWGQPRLILLGAKIGHTQDSFGRRGIAANGGKGMASMLLASG